MNPSACLRMPQVPGPFLSEARPLDSVGGINGEPGPREATLPDPRAEPGSARRPHGDPGDGRARRGSRGRKPAPRVRRRRDGPPPDPAAPRRSCAESRRPGSGHQGPPGWRRPSHGFAHVGRSSAAGGRGQRERCRDPRAAAAGSHAENATISAPGSKPRRAPLGERIRSEAWEPSTRPGGLAAAV
jgi:hypothetical protein